MAYYLDTSAFLKLVVHEEHSSALLRWARAKVHRFVSSDLLRTEAVRAARRLGPATLTPVRDLLDSIVLIRLSPAVCDRAATLDPGVLRSLDALHLAAAMTIQPELDGIVTYDDRLAAGAALHGIAVASPR